jgi:hypothetical protein
MMMSKALLTVERYFSHNITTQNRNDQCNQLQIKRQEKHIQIIY